MNRKAFATRFGAAILMMILPVMAGCGARDEGAAAPAAEPAAVQSGAEAAAPAAHEHAFAPATCTEPERCACGEVRGEPLGHNPIGEPDYQNGVTCGRCGEEIEPPLTPGFEEHGLACTMAANADYTYVAKCGGGLTTAGKAQVRAVSILPGCEGYEALEGYEWQFVTAEVSFSDENARAAGAQFSTAQEDYYTIELHDDSAAPLPAAEDGAGAPARMRYTVNWQGQDYEDCLWEYVENPLGWMNGTYTCELRWAFRVPAGYDGCVVVFAGPAATDAGEGKYIYEIPDDSRLAFRITQE